MRLSIDDGCASDIRIADLAAKYEVDCIFYWPVEWRSLAHDKGYEPLTYLDAWTISQSFEVGSHTVTHRHLTKISLQEAYQEIFDSRVMLENLFGHLITKFAPPRGYTNPTVTKYTMGVYKSQRLTKGKGLVHIHPNSGANDNIPWREYAKSHAITEAWGHSWELDKYNLWGELEEFLREYSHS